MTPTIQKPKVLKLIIPGQLPNLKNRRHNVPRKTKTGKTYWASIPDKEVLQYMDDFIRQVPYTKRLKLDGKLSISGTIYYQSNRSDLNIELLLDCLQKAGVIKNDRCIWQHKDLRKEIDSKFPRVEIEINESEEKNEH